ncbi:MAG: glutathione S-transferase [Celeribacter sp.]|jgi:glutathione S-transferase
MTYDLIIGDRLYSSWSLRGWLTLAAFDLPHRVIRAGLYAGTLAQDLARYAPTRTVPVLILPEGQPVQDTLAIAETLAERHPDAGIWPKDAAARAMARWLVAEMHSGFKALRDECPMNLEHRWAGFTVSDPVRADLARIETLWAAARARFGETDRDKTGSPWLFGAYTVADVFYAPVAARIAGYGLPISEPGARYVRAHLAHPLFQDWRNTALEEPVTPRPYRQPLPEAPWPADDIATR